MVVHLKEAYQVVGVRVGVHGGQAGAGALGQQTLQLDGSQAAGESEKHHYCYHLRSEWMQDLKRRLNRKMVVNF